MDLCADMLPPNIRTVLEQNPNATTWSGQEPPYGYLDWWPLSLGFNAQESPYDEPAFRWAVNHAINREQLVEVGWQGAGEPTLLPFPDFPRLRRYTAQVQDLLEQHPVGLFAPARSAALMQESGWQRDAEGIWTRDGAQAKDTARHQPDLPRHRANLSRAVAAGWLCSQHADDLGQLHADDHGRG